MGMALLIESDPSLECPEAFPDTDSKHFLGTMFGPRVEVLERRLKLDLTPLKHCAVDIEGVDEEEFDPEWVAQAKRSSELAWHPPEVFITCLERLATKLEESGRKLPPAVHKAIDPTGRDRDYYQSGVFFSDVSGCLAAMRSLKEQGARRVRFFAF
jgi:hypothetical protein